MTRLTLFLTAFALAAQADTIDLPSVLKLAGAQSLDVQLASEKLNEARANEAGTLWQFFPWIAPGVGYRAHNGRIQDVAGNIIETSKQSLGVGPSVVAQLDLGDAIYKRLAAKQLTKAAAHGVDAQRRQSVLSAAEGYFDLVKSHASARVANEAVETSRDYAGQIENAVKTGVAFKGDQLRAQTQMHHYELLLKQSEEQQRIASAKLVQLLHLEPGTTLTPRNDDAVSLSLMPAGGLDKLLTAALAQRPEMKQSDALAQAADAGVRGAKYGPLIPSLGAQVYAGGLGGGRDGGFGSFGGTADYQITLGWRIGAGGLFDSSRIKKAKSEAAQAQIGQWKTRDVIVREVSENYELAKLLRNEVEIAKRGVAAAQEALKLAKERKEFAIGVVLETLQSEQDLTRAKLDFVNAVLELNKTQYRLKAAVAE